MSNISKGINSVRFENDNASIGAMISLDSELVDLKRRVPVSPEVELWLSAHSVEPHPFSIALLVSH